jgi:CRISPR-associated protein Cas1
VEQVDERMRPHDRNRRPPRDPFNALLSFGYGLLLREVVQAIRTVGLDGSFGFYHRPRSSAPPLALDLMELFRVPIVDMAVVAAVNRQQFQQDADFTCAGQQVWLNDGGRRKAIEIFERRLRDLWRHPVLDYSLSYRRHIELEVRLLEKEWSGEPGLFASARVR